MLNRLYKPLGIRTTEWVEYEPYAVKFQRMTSATAEKLSWEGSGDTDAIYLYNDACIPTDASGHWAAYQARLGHLAKLKLA